MLIGATTGVTNGQLTIFEADLTIWGSSPYVVSETTIAGTYQTDNLITFDSEGYFLLLWESPTDPTFKSVQVLYIGEKRGLYDCRVHVINNGDVPYVPIDGCAVLASLADGTPVDQQLTDIQGVARFQLKSRTTYTMSLRKPSAVFTVNNIEITPIDPVMEELPPQSNQFFLLTTYFDATFDPIERLDHSYLSLMKVDVVDIAGRPIQGVGIHMHAIGPQELVVGPTTFAVTSGSGQLVYTNSNGHAEAYLLRGKEVEVAVEGADIRRYITVPDQADFSLMQLVTGTDDPFEIARPDIYNTPRRTL
jgi:hypothetical protein